MKVFISWSGPRGRYVAEKLRSWLPDVIQATQPWMSERDISAGARGLPEIGAQLSETNFGIICLTRSNQHAPWLLFESGALAKTLEDTFVVPYLIDMEPSDVQGPLAQFQAKRWNKEGTLELVRSVNRAFGKDALEEERVKRLFERSWPELQTAFEGIPVTEGATEQRRPSEEILGEVLEVVRDISRRLPSSLSGREYRPLPDRVLWNRLRHALSERDIYIPDALTTEEQAQLTAEQGEELMRLRANLAEDIRKSDAEELRKMSEEQKSNKDK